jgi:hypothetical protein
VRRLAERQGKVHEAKAVADRRVGQAAQVDGNERAHVLDAAEVAVPVEVTPHRAGDGGHEHVGHGGLVGVGRGHDRRERQPRRPGRLLARAQRSAQRAVGIRRQA